MKPLYLALLPIFCSGTLLANPTTKTEIKAEKPLYLTSTTTWLHLSIISQNAGHKIQMLGVDSGDPDTQGFTRDIQTIDRLLNQLVDKGLLKKQTFQLKPQLDLEESLIKAVGQFVEKASEQYGYYVIREMMDIGTRQRLKKFNENAPVILNVRVPEKLLKELEALLKKNGGE